MTALVNIVADGSVCVGRDFIGSGQGVTANSSVRGLNCTMILSMWACQQTAICCHTVVQRWSRTHNCCNASVVVRCCRNTKPSILTVMAVCRRVSLCLLPSVTWLRNVL